MTTRPRLRTLLLALALFAPGALTAAPPGPSTFSITAADPATGEVGIAVCVARGKGPSEAELAEYLGEKIPRYKMPKRFFFFEELPKSGYGKVPKRLVRDELQKRGLLDFVRAPGASA